MIFGLDFGLKRIGVARLVNGIVIPISPIIRKNRHQASKELGKILNKCLENKNKQDILLVIGLPKASLDYETKSSNNPHITKEQILHFLRLIDFNGRVEFIDESNSSQEALERLKHKSYKSRQMARKNGEIDSISACIILERYIERLSNITNISQTANILKSDETINDNDSKNLIESLHLPNNNKLNLIKSKIQQTNINNLLKDLNRDFKIHIPVLLQEVVSTFDSILSTTESQERINNSNIKHNNQDIQIHNFLRECKQCLIDCTLGFGGMSKTLLENYDNLSIIGIDRDTEAIKANQAINNNFSNRLHIHWGDFASVVPRILQICECYPGKLKGILVDMGVSSYQLDCTSRGFNFQAQNLDMRMDSTQKLHAAQILNSYSNYELQRIFRDYGEIPYYKKLARLIIEARQKGAITGEILQNIALKISNKKKIHPATLIYQALRIEVNDELGQLARLLESCSKINNAIVCFISFHSLEDKMIKESMKKWAKSCICEDNSMKCECGNNHSKGKIIYKKPLTATNEELRHNPRARSAKLRAFYFF